MVDINNVFLLAEVKQENYGDYGNIEVKREPPETTGYQDDRRGEKRRDISPPRQINNKKQRHGFIDGRVEDEPEFDASVVALDWCKYINY